MANTLKMAQTNTIRTLLERGWSHRRIAAELGVHRETVGRYAKLFASEDPKPAKVTAGTDGSKPAKVTAGAPGIPCPEPAKVAAGAGTRRSLCEPFRDVVLRKLESRLTAQRIHQDLVEEHDFEHSYETVKRFVRSLGKQRPLPFRRVETLPGEEAQVDFGQGALIEQPGKRRRRPHLFRLVLSFSRRGYSEVVWRQDTETFIRCLENAFAYFGGVPKTLVIDNLRAAVTKADWYEPELNPKFTSFARHYGLVVLPTKPYTPRHKGKVESGIKYSQENAAKGRVFETLEAQNHFLLNWERNVADQRIHGTTRRQVRQLFEGERAELAPLPPTRFPLFQEAERKVHRDGHIAIEQAFYSVPPEYLGHTVWVRWSNRMVRVFDQRFKQIAVHTRVLPGNFSTRSADIAVEKLRPIERGAEYYLGLAVKVGPESGRWSQQLIRQKGVHGIRALQGFLTLTKHHSSRAIERAAKIALSHDVFRLKAIRRLLTKGEGDFQTAFLETHPLIRDMTEYGELVRQGTQPRPASSQGGRHE